jgi:hypothetical protein
MRPSLPLLLVQAAVATHLSPAPHLQLSCGDDYPDCVHSESLPLHGSRAQASVTFAGASAPPPPWVRLDRCDVVINEHGHVVKDNTVWDEYFPRWAPTSGGGFDFDWQVAKGVTAGGSGSGSITVVASGWTARYNGTRLTENSTNATVFFSFDYRSSTSLVNAIDVGPGSVRLLGTAGAGVNTTEADRAHWADTCTFSVWTLDNTGKTGKWWPQLNFIPQSANHQVAPVTHGQCAINLTFTAPGIWFYGGSGERNGLGQEAPSACPCGHIHGDQRNCPCDRPLALVIPFLNGSRPSLPAGFVGHVHVVQALKTPHQFCIIQPNVTAFAGSQLKIPLCPKEGDEIPHQPRFATFLAATWLTVVGKSNDTNPTSTKAVLNSSKHIPPGHGPAAGNAEARLQQTFDGGGRWEIYNDFVRAYLTFAQQHVGKSVTMHVLLHDNLDELTAVEADPSKWQRLSIELVATPDLRPLLAWGKTKLMTALTWTDAGLFFNGTTIDGNYSYLETYARFGFNTVPGHCRACPGCGPTHRGALGDEFAYSGNRTAARGWSGLQYGPEMSGFSRMYGMSKQPLKASLLPKAFVIDEATEMLKWERAKNFTLTAHGFQHMVDMAYDGAFARADIADFCQAVNASRPEWIFVDDEGWPGTWSYSQYGFLSQNAQARRLPGETDFDLTWRMVSEFLHMWSDCLGDMPSTSNTRTMYVYYSALVLY